MKNSSRIICVVLAALAIFASGCGDDSEPADEVREDPKTVVLDEDGTGWNPVASCHAGVLLFSTGRGLSTEFVADCDQALDALAGNGELVIPASSAANTPGEMGTPSESSPVNPDTPVIPTSTMPPASGEN